MRLPEGQRSSAWVQRLSEVVAALNNEVTCLTGKKPAVALKKILFMLRHRHLIQGLWGNAKKISPPFLVRVRYLYQPSELEGVVKRSRVTDPIWFFKVHGIERSFTKPDQRVLYYFRDEPKRGFVREELVVVPPSTELPPGNSSISS